MGLLRKFLGCEGHAELFEGGAALGRERFKGLEVKAVELRGIEAQHVTRLLFATSVEGMAESQARVGVGALVVGIVAAP